MEEPGKEDCGGGKLAVQARSCGGMQRGGGGGYCDGGMSRPLLVCDSSPRAPETLLSAAALGVWSVMGKDRWGGRSALGEGKRAHRRRGGGVVRKGRGDLICPEIRACSARKFSFAGGVWSDATNRYVHPWHQIRLTQGVRSNQSEMIQWHWSA
jgi:hypothetical protein